MAVVRALRAAGHDVTAIAEIEPALDDDAVFARAVAEQRIVLSEDKDFGRFSAADPVLPGVVLLRFEARARTLIAEAAVELFELQADRLIGRFAVLEPGRVRFHRP